MRRRDDWSKWISKSMNNEFSSLPNSVNIDNQKENKKDSPDGTTELHPTEEISTGSLSLAVDAVESSMVSLSLAADAVENPIKNSTNHSKDNKEQRAALGNSNSRIELSCLPNSENPKVMNFGESSNDFSSTFMLDEELDLELKPKGHDHPFTAGRYIKISSCLI